MRMGLSTYVIRRNTPWDNPNIVQVQPKCEENKEIPGMSVHLILKQHYHWYLCLDIFLCLLLSLTIRILFGLLLIFPADWQLTDGGPSLGSLETQPFSMCLILLLYPELTVIGNLSSSLSYYISPLGYPVYPWEYFTLQPSPTSPPSVGHGGPAI